ncbi:MAG: hypothetical protein ABW065_01850 [Solirubrobacterales bacterium]
MKRVFAAIACLVTLASLAIPSSSSAARSSTPAGKVPPGFFGVVPQGPLSETDLNGMKGVVATLRVPVYWVDCEPEQGRYDFTTLDALVGSAAQRGIRILPYVYGTPAWLTSVPARPPLSGAASTAWASFLRVLVGRYGPGGSFWAARTGARLPIHSWQIWNEPNFVLFWKPKPSPRSYARLLAISSRAIRSRDRAAKIVAAGLAPVGAGLTPWDFLYGLYQVPDAKRNFDVVAIHPYASTLRRMTAQVKVARAVMRNAGDAAKPLIISELGVASGGQRSVFVKGLAGQARFLSESFSLLLKERLRWHIAGIDWFTWRDSAAPNPYCSFCQGAGLFDVGGQPKPSWTAYKRAVAAAVR